MSSSSQNNTLEATMRQLFQSVQNDIAGLATEITHIKTRIHSPESSNFSHEPTSSNLFSPTSIKLDIPRFDGSDPFGWVFKITQSFEFHKTPGDHRLRLASFYMEGEALTWFQWMHANHQIQSWPMFIQALENRFAPTQYEDPRGALFKLCQTTTVKEYQTQFETLGNRIIGLPPPFYLSCFVSGLRPEIRREVQAFQPISLA